MQRHNNDAHACLHQVVNRLIHRQQKSARATARITWAPCCMMQGVATCSAPSADQSLGGWVVLKNKQCDRRTGQSTTPWWPLFPQMLNNPTLMLLPLTTAGSPTHCSPCATHAHTYNPVGCPKVGTLGWVAIGFKGHATQHCYCAPLPGSLVDTMHLQHTVLIPYDMHGTLHMTMQCSWCKT